MQDELIKRDFKKIVVSEEWRSMRAHPAEESLQEQACSSLAKLLAAPTGLLAAATASTAARAEEDDRAAAVRSPPFSFSKLTLLNNLLHLLLFLWMPRTNREEYTITVTFLLTPSFF